jgi:hypothetical protein
VNDGTIWYVSNSNYSNIDGFAKGNNIAVDDYEVFQVIAK